MYEYGIGVELDLARAAKWYRMAAELGDHYAQFFASVMYYKGEGVPRDRIEAAKWWTLSMTKGGRWADNIRASVESAESKLTPDESAEGKRRASQWQLAHETK
jgi:TPR repeat protein